MELFIYFFLEIPLKGSCQNQKNIYLFISIAAEGYIVNGSVLELAYSEEVYE